MINWSWEVCLYSQLSEAERPEGHEFKDGLDYIAVPCLLEKKKLYRKYMFVRMLPVVQNIGKQKRLLP